MAATKFVVTVSQATGRIRRITVFPEASESDHHLSTVLVGHGETNIHLPIAQLTNHIALQPVVDAMLSIKRIDSDDLYDCFDATGKLVTSIHCDPLCGDGPLPSLTMVKRT